MYTIVCQNDTFFVNVNETLVPISASAAAKLQPVLETLPTVNDVIKLAWLKILETNLHSQLSNQVRDRMIKQLAEPLDPSTRSAHASQLGLVLERAQTQHDRLLRTCDDFVTVVTSYDLRPKQLVAPSAF